MQLIDIDQNLWFKAYPAIAANGLLFIYAVFAKPKLRIYLLIFSATTLMDIFIASKLISVNRSEVQTGLEYIFVLVGDLRFILLLAYVLYAQQNLADLARFRLSGAVLKPAFIFTLFPTVLVTAIGLAKPNLFTQARHKFLAYELIFFTLTFLWIFVVLPQKNIAEPERKFLKQSAIPVFIFYGLWALADILILNGIEMGYVIRIVPNLTYYCVFLWWVHKQAATT